MLHCRLAVLAFALSLSFAAPVSAQLGDPGYQITAPQIVSVGAVFEMCLYAPGNSQTFLMVGITPGSTPTKFGTLGLGLPVLAIIPFPMPASGQFCFPPDRNIPCYPELVGVTMYMQLIALGPDAEQHGISNVTATAIADVGKCGSFGGMVTYTQGGYGGTCSGNNPACVLQANFDAVFPGGLLLGDPDGIDGDSEYALLLTSAAAVAVFLPEGTPRDPFDHDAVDPTNSEAGVLSGQLTAAKINVELDAAGVFDASKTDPSVKLADLIFVASVHPALLGMSVQELIALTDQLISGALTAPVDVDGDLVGDVGFVDLSAALDVLNQNFDNGTQNNGNLALP